MGQRHQVYIIKNKKCVAALHHQWLYGRAPLLRLAALLTLLKSKEAKEALDIAYSDGIILDKNEFDPIGADNNDGITIVDITDPYNMKYCFMNIDHLEGEYDPPVFVPLSAKDYVQAYYPDLTIDELKAIHPLKSYTLLDMNTITKTWPSIRNAIESPCLPRRPRFSIGSSSSQRPRTVSIGTSTR